MKKTLLIYFLIVFIPNFAQIPGYKLTNWQYAGNINPIYNLKNKVTLESFGGKALANFNNDTAIVKAINFLKTNGGGTVLFGNGIYTFNQTIVLADSITLKGNSSNTTLQFNLAGKAKNCINVYGSISTLKSKFLLAKRGAYTLQLFDGKLPLKNNIIQLFQNDSALAFSTWAYSAIGQLCKVQSVDTFNNSFLLLSPLRLSFKQAINTYFKILNPIQNVSIECMKIERLDTTSTQTHNINFNYAFNCRVKGVETINCNFGHIVFENSLHNEVTQSYIHHAFAYGGGGQGYGVVMQATSSDNKVENNIFERLRHSNLMQAGANGNVVAYNYSTDPFWSDNALTNAAGDMVCHGNYAHSNLFEGNICQNIVVDNSHGKNGPYNTFFRNRAELYGLISNAQDSQNYIANEITNTAFFMGQFFVGGVGNFALKNNIKGALQSSSLNVSEPSLYLNSKPNFLNSNNAFPAFGFPTVYNTNFIASKTRYLDSVEKIFCYTPKQNIATSIYKINNQQFNIYPNPFSNAFKIETELPINSLEIFDINGKKMQFKLQDNSIDTNLFPYGIYIVIVNHFQSKIIIKN